MSILIKGMEMPKDGAYWCEIGVAGEIATITIHGEDRKSFRLVPVPPHVDLIDRDALIDDLKRQCKEVFRVNAVSPDDFWITRNEAYNERLWGTWCESFYGYLQTRPTVIPAEESEDG